MATDGPTPAPCNKKIFKKGTHVFTMHSLGPNAIEGWVRKVAERSGQSVDWHYAAGRACVLALGDLDRVRAVLEELRPEYENQLKEKFPHLYG